MLGSSVEPDLLDTMKSVFARSTLRFDGLAPARDRWSRGRTARGSPGIAAEGLLPDLGAEARAAHAEEQRVGEAFALHLLAAACQRGRQVVELRLHDARASRASSPRRAPVQSEASPAKSRRVPPCASHACEPLRRPRRRAPRGARQVWRVDARLVGLAAAPLHRLQELRERLDELLEPVVEQVVGDLAPARSPAFSRSSRVARAPVDDLPRGWPAAGRGRGRRRASPAAPCSRCRGRSAPRRRARRGSAGSWCRCWPRARAASARPSRASASQRGAGEDRACSSGRPAWRWRSPPCRRRPSSRALSAPGAVLSLLLDQRVHQRCRCGSRRSWRRSRRGERPAALRRAPPGPRCRPGPPPRRPRGRRAA